MFFKVTPKGSSRAIYAKACFFLTLKDNAAANTLPKNKSHGAVRDGAAKVKARCIHEFSKIKANYKG